eukprot:250433-Prorocentrum_minimum.AAC.2
MAGNVRVGAGGERLRADGPLSEGYISCVWQISPSETPREGAHPPAVDNTTGPLASSAWGV